METLEDEQALLTHVREQHGCRVVSEAEPITVTCAERSQPPAAALTPWPS